MMHHEADQPATEIVVRIVPDAHQTFWDRAEGLVLGALEDYAKFASGDRELARRLFADDATRGFALIDVCRKQFDVVLMNPPFGDGSKPSKPYIERAYPRTKNDLYRRTFVECGLKRLLPDGHLGRESRHEQASSSLRSKSGARRSCSTKRGRPSSPTWATAYSIRQWSRPANVLSAVKCS